MNPRTIIAAVSYLGVLCLFWMTDFGDRGYYFSTDGAVASVGSGVIDEENYNLKDLVLLNRSIGYIRSNYVEPERISPRNMLVGALDSIQNSVAEMLIDVSRNSEKRPTDIRIVVDTKSQDFDLGRVDDLYEMTWKLKDCLHFIDESLPKDVSRADVEYAAVNGMLRTLDPHSVLLNPKTYTQMQVGTSGKFGGLGIVISTRKGQLTIMTVLPETPAKRSGLKNRDQITQIGEESTINMTLEEAVQLLRGKVGTEVTIWVMREEWSEPRPIHVVREEIHIQSVQSRSLGEGVGYIKIKNFQQNTFSDLKSAIGELEAQNSMKNGLVIDLRNDPGGLLDQAIEVSDLFLSDGTIVTTVGGGARIREEKKATRKGTRQRIPLVILVNSGSASASEIVTGALKNNDRAVILGAQTFGKGSVQVLYEIRDQLERVAALKLTIAQYLTPGDQSIQSVGIAPDILMYPVAIGKKEVDLYVSEKDLAGERDLDNHLMNTRAEAGMATEIVRYYESAEEDDPEEDDEDDLPAKPYGVIEVDYLMAFSRDFLVSSGSASRDKMLTRARPYLTKVKSREDKKIRERLQELNVDWVTGETQLNAPIDVTLTVDPPDGVVQAGEEFVLRAKVVNVSDKAFYKVRAESQSENARLANREWIFGRIDPGATATWDVPVKIAKNAYTRKDPMSLKFFADEVPLAHAKVSTSVTIQALPRPIFSYSYRIDDHRGNRDGLLQKGEDVDLIVSLCNVGEGDAHKTRAYVKNLNGEDVFLSKGKGKIEALPAGERAQFPYSFRVQGDGENGDISFQIDIVDTVLGAQTSSQIHIQLAEPSKGRYEASEASFQTTRDAALYNGSSSSSPILGNIPKGGHLQQLGRLGEWAYVQAQEDVFGWVLKEVLMERSQKEGTALVAFEPTWMEVPPIIRLDETSLAILETDSHHFSLKGSVLFGGKKSARQDVYIFRNEDKVYFGNSGAESDDSDRVVPIDMKIPLEDGVNSISIYARSDKNTYSQRRLLIHKR